MVLPGGTLGGTAGPLMAGRTFDVTGSYRIAFRVLTLLAVIGFVPDNAAATATGS